MRRLVFILIAVVLIPGCTVRGAKIAGLGIVGATAGGVLMTTAALDDKGGTWAGVYGGSGALIMVAGGVLMYWGMGVGIRGFLTTEERPPPPPVVVDPAAVARDNARARAWQLTKEAEASARADDCARVRAIDPQVHRLDAGFYDAVFLRDVAITRCIRQ